MSQENVEVVRRWWEAWNADDFGRGMALMDDGLVTRRLPPMPDPGIWHGPEGLLDVAAEWVETFDEFAMTGDDFVDAGERVVAVLRVYARGRQSGVEVERLDGAVYTMRDGKCVRLDYYGSKEQALEAVGLRETDRR